MRFDLDEFAKWLDGDTYEIFFKYLKKHFINKIFNINVLYHKPWFSNQSVSMNSWTYISDVYL